MVHYSIIWGGFKPESEPFQESDLWSGVVAKFEEIGISLGVLGGLPSLLIFYASP